MLPRKSIETSSHGLSGKTLGLIGSGVLCGETARHGIQFLHFSSTIESIKGNHTFSRNRVFVFTIPKCPE